MASEESVILLVDDEPDILEFLGYNLRREGFRVFTATNGREALAIALREKPGLIILDVMMPEMDGIETCREMRRMPELSDSVIAFLTARSEDYSQLAGFEAGGDDYISKPIKPALLISRVKALLRRSRKDAADVTDTNAPSLVVDRERYVVVYRGKKLILPRKEFELLALLVSRPNKVFSRQEIFSAVWGDDVVVGDRTIDVHVRKIREKVGIHSIRTVKGIGYTYQPENGLQEESSSH